MAGAFVVSPLAVGAALVAVLAALLLAARVARSTGAASRAGKRLAVEEALSLDGKRRLLLVRCDGRTVLLVTGGPQDLSLGWLPAEDKP